MVPVMRSSWPRTLALYCAAAAGFFLLCLWIQARSGAWDAPFSAYPDEAAHFTGSVMVRDYLASGFKTGPLTFAQRYYEHYPFFAIGYWPPVFYVVSGVSFLLFGAGRVQALMVVAGATAGTAWLILVLVRRRAGWIAGVCAGLLFLALPVVQRWTCAVMIDGMVAFFCLAAAVCLIHYLESGTMAASLGFALCASAATLTKYSGAYVCLLSFAAIVCLGRFKLLRSPAFLLQLAVIGALVGPWVFWTRKFYATGLLGWESSGSVPSRMIGPPLAPFELFPPVLLVIIVLGVLALAALPRASACDIVVAGLLYLGLTGSLAVAPVEVEHRYVMAGTAALIVLSFAGWTALAARLPVAWRRPELAALPPLLLAVYFVPANLFAYPRAPQYQIKSAVGWIDSHRSVAQERILVPPDLEGPVIAQFATLKDRGAYHLKRPFKLFSDCDWFTRNYRSKFPTSAGMLDSLISDPVDLVIWHGIPAARNYRHEQLMEEMLRDNPARWREVASFAPTAEDPLPWRVYRFIPTH